MQQPTHNERAPVGVLDSGIGGLSVANAIFDLLPFERIHYFGDLAYMPYGVKTQEKIIERVFKIIDFLRSQRCKAIVMACNTASSAALNAARVQWPDLPIIGMEPAVKPAVQASKTRKIGVLATESTIESDRYQSLVDRFAHGVTVIEDTCAGLAKSIDEGNGPSAISYALLEAIVPPMIVQGVDTFVLGCTHYPFVKNQIQALAGPDATIIDPSFAVAKQLKRKLEQAQLLATSPLEGTHQFYTSKQTATFTEGLSHFAKAKYEGPFEAEL
ncbi:MAG: glutamate racemase [Bacteroidota bacterium]